MRYLEGDGRVFLNRHKETYDLILVDAFHGGYVPFHLLTREFYTLVRQRLAPGGAAAFNVHDGTKLYASTLLTLRAVFSGLHLYPSGQGEMITVVTADAAPDPAVLAQRGERPAGEIPLPLRASRPARAPHREGPRDADRANCSPTTSRR